MGKLIINCGGMFSGKTTALQQQGERYLLAKKKVVFIKPSMDIRYSDLKIVTHAGREVEAYSVGVDTDLSEFKNYEVILIDEIQFFEKSILAAIDSLLKKGKTVIVAGLDMDFEGNPFTITSQLMGMADTVNKYKAICQECGEEATFSYRCDKSKEVIVLGEKDKYKPLCRRCFYENEKGK